MNKFEVWFIDPQSFLGLFNIQNFAEFSNCPETLLEFSERLARTGFPLNEKIRVMPGAIISVEQIFDQPKP